MSLLLVIRYAEEGPGLYGWARRAAEAMELPLEVILCDPEAGTKIVWQEASAERPEYLADEEVRWGRVRLTHALPEVLEYVAESKASHVLTGQQNSGQHAKNSLERQFSRALFEEVPCTVAVLRLPEDGDVVPGRILVPVAGGTHSRVALRLAASLAGEHATAFFVEPDTDDISREVGQRQLDKSVKRAGIDPESITCKVALGSKIGDEIRSEAETGQYELVLIGASDSRTMRAKLFGTVPERLLRGPHGLGVGVIRAPLPSSWRMKEALGRVLRLSVPQLEREERIALVDEVEGKARWTFDFAILMALATAIAALGLLANSVAVVIGAMLVAPLMTPVVGGGLAVVQGNWPLWRRSSRAVMMGFFCALVIGLLAGIAARWLGFGLTSELAARGEPTLLDLGVAFAAGIAASYCLARPHLSGALAGVAIAAALVPPVATVGICLALGETMTAQGAALLFGTNVVAIVLGAAANFFAAGIRGRRGRWSGRLVIVLALVCVGFAIPLTSILVGKVTAPRVLQRSLAEVAEDSGYRLLKLRRSGKSGERLVEIELAGPEAPGRELLDRLRKAAARSGKGKVRLRVRTLLETEWPSL